LDSNLILLRVKAATAFSAS